MAERRATLARTMALAHFLPCGVAAVSPAVSWLEESAVDRCLTLENSLNRCALEQAEL